MDLQYIRENFTGKYKPRSKSESDEALLHLQKNPGFTDEEGAVLANGLRTLDLSISPDDNQFQLIDNNGRTIRFHIDTEHNGFWFIDYLGQSIARYEDDTLIIETGQFPTEKRVTYKFLQYQLDPKSEDPRTLTRDIRFKMSIGMTLWGMIYEKVE